ncbi:C3H1-type domain-containing protein [Mycena venus]|uniref:C3H1-type domain-containing protein n=1 Tax=Mycena venus TaxID=2733690 RepID=A0A8H6XAW1_9AGAR|nr:C3H1-type domain-containing protein [Mycena venus]
MAPSGVTNATDAPWRVKTRPCPFYAQGKCVFEQSCNFVHDISLPIASSSSRNRLPELLDALGDVLDPVDNISLVSEHGTSPHIPGEGWTLVNETKDSLLSPVSLPDLKLSRLSSLKNDSFDSGYASEFSSPQPLPSTLNLLASPFGSPSSRMSISGSRLFARSPLSPGFTSPMSNRNDSPELDSPSVARRGSVSTITPAQQDDEDDDDDQYSTAQWTMSANTTLNNPVNVSRFSTSTVALTEDYCSGSESDEEEAEESTAHLAYLASPTPRTFPPDENDTINTLYDVYLHSPPQATLPSSDTEEERGRIRARVFTPPPPSRKFNPRESTPPVSRRSEACSLAALAFHLLRSPTHPESLPPRSMSSMSNRGPVPFTFRNEASCSSQPEMSSPEPMPSPSIPSGKVPFGFRSESRNSRRSLGPASASALQSAFSDAPPRKRRISRSVAPQSASAQRTSFFQTDNEPSPPPTVKGLKHLRLSKVLVPPASESAFPFPEDDPSTNSTVPPHRTYTVHSASPSLSVPSSHSAPIPSNTHIIPDSDDDYVRTRHDTIRPSQARHDLDRALRSAPLQHSWQTAPDAAASSQNPDEDDGSNNDTTIRRRIPPAPIHIPPTHPTSPMRAASALAFVHPATPRPTLLFAIASDDPEAVRPGESALQFTLANKQLSNRFEIARVLLAFGAQDGAEEVPGTVDPAMRYYVRRAGEEHAKGSSALIHRSFFRPLTRMRYELVGQDRALEQLFRVLSIHSQQLMTVPVVVLLCGPSGHGKSLLARKFGALLDVPTHTVNMTTLRSAHDLWQAYSMNPYEEPSTCTLAEFLINNEGKRCVVVLDEIEKVEEKTLWSLLMPWESGASEWLARSLEANSRPIDVRNVVWLGTSNVGHDVVAEHHAKRERPEELMSREEYLQLMNLVRVPVSKHMGASVLSRVTTVLPFVPFTRDEQTAICAEAFHALAGELIAQLPPDRLDALIRGALLGYVPSEGARNKPHPLRSAASPVPDLALLGSDFVPIRCSHRFTS